MAYPNLPVPVQRDEQEQVDGQEDTKPVYQTHRGFRPTSHEAKEPPFVQPPEGHTYYEGED